MPKDLKINNIHTNISSCYDSSYTTLLCIRYLLLYQKPGTKKKKTTDCYIYKLSRLKHTGYMNIIFYKNNHNI